MKPDHCKIGSIALFSFLSMLLLVQTLVTAEELSSHPGVETFESNYKEITEAVQAGSLPSQTGAEADGLNLAFQKYLIQSNARIEVYRLEAREYTGARQGEALDNLIQATEERERTILGYIQKLDGLSGGRSAVAPVYDTKGYDTKGIEEIMPSPEPPAAKKVEEAETGEETKEKKEKFALPEKKWEVKEMDIEIELSPHDMINEPLP